MPACATKHVPPRLELLSEFLIIQDTLELGGDRRRVGAGKGTRLDEGRKVVRQADDQRGDPRDRGIQRDG